MGRPEDDHIAALLAEAQDCLRAGRHRDAEQAFGRVLLLDARHAEAQAGRARATAALAEEQRRLDALLAEARRLWRDGRPGDARRLLDEILRSGGDRDAALGLLDRIDDARALPAALTMPTPVPPVVAARLPMPRRVWRRVLAAAWLVVFLLLGAGVASAWDDLVARLTDLPGARGGASATTLNAPTRGELALRAARRALERDDPQAALTLLGELTPDDPVYPFAVQIRAQAARAAGARGRR